MCRMVKVLVLAGLALLLLGMPLLAACKGGTITAPAVTMTKTVTATPSPTTPAATTTKPPTTTPAPPKEVTVTIGYSLPITGALAGFGIAIQRAIGMAEAKINSEGIVVGGVKYKFASVIEDDAYTADKAVTAANKFLFTDKLNIIAFFGTGPVGAATPLLKGKEVLYFAQGSGPVISPENTNIFRTLAGTVEQYPPQVKWFKQNHPEIKKVFFIVSDDSGGNAIFTGLGEALKYYSIEILGNERYPRTTTEFSPLIARAMAANPDAIITTGTGPTGNLVKQLREKGYKGLIWIGSNADADYIKLAGAAALEGALGQNLELGSPLVPEGVRILYNEYNAKYGSEPTIYALDFYSIPYIVASAIKKAGSVEIKKLIEAMETGEVDSAWGKIRFAGKDIYGINHQAYVGFGISEFRDGKPKLLHWITPDEQIATVKEMYGKK